MLKSSIYVCTEQRGNKNLTVFLSNSEYYWFRGIFFLFWCEMFIFERCNFIYLLSIIDTIEIFVLHLIKFDKIHKCIVGG